MITLLIKSKETLFFTLLTVISISLNAQSALDKYVEAGIKSNIVLQQKNIGKEKAMLTLKIANSMFYPSIGIKGDYLSGEGGRSITIPTGDLLNPVYSTLNQLTSSNAFPQISNVETNFFPNNFYDARLRTSMPVINSDLIYNHRVQKEQAAIQQYDADVYKYELIKNIKVAYYWYLGALNSVSIYESALLLSREAKRVNESLLNNGKSIKAYVIRSESEIQNLEAKKSEAIQFAKNSQLYFNFLINADSGQAIDTAGSSEIDRTLVEKYLISDPVITDRTELKMLANAEKINSALLKMSKSWWVPRLNAFLDLGSQAGDWVYNDKSRYYLAGLQLDVPLFAAGKNSYKIKQSKLDFENQLLYTQYNTKQIQLAASTAKNSLITSYEKYNAALKQLESASYYNSLIEKGYKEGMNTFIETIDARNQLTSASMLVVVNKFQLLGAVAAYEREINK